MGGQRINCGTWKKRRNERKRQKRRKEKDEKKERKEERREKVNGKYHVCIPCMHMKLFS